LFTSDVWAIDSVRKGSSPMDDIPGIRLPFSRRVGEGLWRATRRPRVDRWLDGADWLYCPKELYVPVARTRSAVTVHDLYRLEPAYRERVSRSDMRWRWILKRALREAELVLAVSEFTTGRIVDLVGMPVEKIRVVGNGVDDGFCEVAREGPERIDAARKARYLLSVGGVTHKKGAGHLLAVAAE